MLAQKIDFAKEFNNRLTLQDRVRLHLESQGQKYIPTTIKELAERIGVPGPNLYQVINLLNQRNEISLEKESLPNGREKIVGINLIKLEPSGRTYKRAADRSGRVEHIRPKLETVKPVGIPSLPKTVEYLEKKLAVEDMRSRALSANLDESVIAFEPDPLGEECILLLKLFTDLRHEYEQLKEDYKLQGFDLEAEKRNVEFLKNKVKEETIVELRNMGD